MKPIGDPFVPVGVIPPAVNAMGHIVSNVRQPPRVRSIGFGLKVVHGVRDLKPIFGAPEGRQRLRMRNDVAAKLFVKTNDGIRCFCLEDCGDRWFCNPKLEHGRNVRF